jgi:hypothetical protein
MGQLELGLRWDFCGNGCDERSCWHRRLVVEPFFGESGQCCVGWR